MNDLKEIITQFDIRLKVGFGMIDGILMFYMTKLIVLYRILPTIRKSVYVVFIEFLNSTGGMKINTILSL